MALIPVPQNAARVPAFRTRGPNRLLSRQRGYIRSACISGNKREPGEESWLLGRTGLRKTIPFVVFGKEWRPDSVPKKALKKPWKKFSTISSLRLKSETCISFGWPLFRWAVSPQSKPPAVTALQPKNLSTTSASIAKLQKHQRDLTTDR